MASKEKLQQSKTSQSADELMLSMRKTYGTGTIKAAFELEPVERLQTGIFALDLATGGGIPRGKVSIIFGPEGCNKTNLTLKLIAMTQKAYPDERCVFVDMEHAFDPAWSTQLGVNCEQLILLQPEYGEQAVDMVNDFLGVVDLGLLVIDSLATISPLKTVEDEAEKAIVGGNAMLIQKLMHRTLHRLSQAANDGRFPTVVAINQIRFKIGQMMGNPEKMPGGKALDHMSGLTLRTYAKGVVDSKVHGAVPAYKDMTVTIKKHKVPILDESAEFRMAMIHGPAQIPGQIKDWNTFKAHLEALGWASKLKKGYELLGTEFPTWTKMREYLHDNPDIEYNLRQKVIETEVERLYVAPPEDSGEPAQETEGDEELELEF